MASITLSNDGSLRAPHGTIGNAIRALRTERGWSQDQLAKKLSVSQPAISNMESGRISPSVRTAKLLSIEFNVSLEFILAHRRRLF